MNIKKLAIVFCTLSLASSCVTVYQGDKVAIGEPRILRLDVSPSDTLDFRFDVGEVTITGTDDEKMRAKMIVKCPEFDNKCAKHMADIDFVSSTSAEGFSLSTNKHSAFKLSSFKFKNATIITRIEIPIVRQVNIQMTAGELDLKHVNACINIDMSAGEVNVEVLKENIASVDIDTGVGEASLNINGRKVREKRSLLIGGEIQWHGGNGDCHLKIDLQAGEATVKLSE